MGQREHYYLHQGIVLPGEALSSQEVRKPRSFHDPRQFTEGTQVNGHYLS